MVPSVLPSSSEEFLPSMSQIQPPNAPPATVAISPETVVGCVAKTAVVIPTGICVFPSIRLPPILFQCIYCIIISSNINYNCYNNFSLYKAALQRETGVICHSQVQRIQAVCPTCYNHTRRGSLSSGCIVST